MWQNKSRFISPPDPHLFNERVWEIVRRIPAGKVSTYGKIAALLPPPSGVSPQNYLAFGARWVGGALAVCPSDVPWHRVINAQGKISLRQGAELQHKLLVEEGVEFDDQGRINLKKYGWEEK